MNTTKGRYFPHGLPARMLRHFAEHPGAEMTRAQLAALFCVSRANVSMSFKKLSDEGRLEAVSVIREPRVPDADDLLLWACGTQCYRHEASQLTHMSDDYRVVPFGTAEYAALTDE